MSSPEGTQQCCICLGHDLPLWQPHCGHLLHASCFKKHIVANMHDEMAQRCPCCRYALTDNELIQLAEADEIASSPDNVIVTCALLHDCGVMRPFGTDRRFRCRVCARETPYNMFHFSETVAPVCPRHGKRTIRAEWSIFTWHRLWVCVDEGDIIADCAFGQVDDPIDVDPPARQIEIIATDDDDDDDDNGIEAHGVLEADEDEIQTIDLSAEYNMLVDIFTAEPTPDFSIEYDMLVSMFN